MIIDYEYYSSHGGNKVPQSEFDKYSTMASNIIKLNIMNRDYSQYIGTVKNTACLVVDLVYDKEQLKTYERSIASGIETGKSSEKVGDYSVTYASYNSSDISNVLASYDDEIEGVIHDNLFFTGLLNKAIGVIR